MIVPSRTGRRCKRDAVEGSWPPRCQEHIDAKAKKTDPYYVPRYYQDVLRPTLAAQVQRILDEAPAIEAASIDEELAISRRAAMEMVKLFDEAVESKNSDAARTASIGVLQIMEDVTRIAERCARVENIRAAVAGPMTTAIEHLIGKCLRCAWAAFGDDIRVKDFEEALRKDLQLVKALGGTGPGGTSLLPSGQEVDATALAMDDTVPNEES